MDIDSLDATSNNYLLSIKMVDKHIGVAYIDITTGEFKAVEVEKMMTMGNY